MNESFEESYEKLVGKYAPALQQLGVDQTLLGDVIEIWEDFERLHPMLNSIMELNATEDEFRSMMFKLEAWSWHTSDHLRRLYKLLSEGDNSQDD